MRPKQTTIDAAKANGSIDKMTRLVSAVQILNCEANTLIEEANDLMLENNLSIGLIKKLHSDFLRSADRYFKEFESLVHTEESKMNMFSDLDNFDKLFREWMKSPSDWKSKESKGGQS